MRAKADGKTRWAGSCFGIHSCASLAVKARRTMRKTHVAALIATVGAVLGTGVALGIAGEAQSPAERTSTLGNDTARIFERLDSATESPLPERVAVAVGRGHPEMDATRSVLAASHGPAALHLTGSTRAGRVCWIASHDDEALSSSCGLRSNIANGQSMSLVVAGDSQGRGANGVEFLVVPDGFDQVVTPFGTSEVRDNIAIVPRKDIGGPQEPRAFRRVGSHEILRIAG